MRMQMDQVKQALDALLVEALAAPDSANILDLLNELDRSIAPLHQEAQLRIAGEILERLADLCVARARWLLPDWEEPLDSPEDLDSSVEPILTAADLQGFLRQSMSLHLEELIEPASLPQAQSSNAVIIGIVEQAHLLAFLAQLQQQKSQTTPLDVAHHENVSHWIQTIAQWLHQQSPPRISLVELHQALQMPLVEIWLALLLGGYELEQQGAFYDPEAIWIVSPQHTQSHPNHPSFSA